MRALALLLTISSSIVPSLPFLSSTHARVSGSVAALTLITEKENSQAHRDLIPMTHNEFRYGSAQRGTLVHRNPQMAVASQARKHGGDGPETITVLEPGFDQEMMKAMRYFAFFFAAQQADRGNHAPADFPNPSILTNRFDFLCGRVERGTGHHQS